MVVAVRASGLTCVLICACQNKAYSTKPDCAGVLKTNLRLTKKEVPDLQKTWDKIAPVLDEEAMLQAESPSGWHWCKVTRGSGKGAAALLERVVLFLDK